MAISWLNSSPLPTRGSMVPLRGLQLLCCAAVAGLGLHVSSLGQPARDATRTGDQRLRNWRGRRIAVDAALQAASASLSRIQVVVQRNDTLDQIFRRLQLVADGPGEYPCAGGGAQALDRLLPATC